MPSWLLCPKALHQHSQSIAASSTVCTTCAHTNTHTKAETKSSPESHLGARAYSVHYSGRHASDHFLVALRIRGEWKQADRGPYLNSSAIQRLRDKRGIFQGLSPPSPHMNRHLSPSPATLDREAQTSMCIKLK